MRKITLGFALIVGFLPLISWGQPRAMDDRIEALRIAFFTEKLQLTPEESQSFWPLYNEYQDKEKAIRKSYKNDKSLELMSDAEAEKLIETSFEMEEKTLQLKKEYYGKMRGVLPVRKIALLSRIDRQFKERLLEEWRNRQEQKRPGNVPPKRN
ncbi:MAG: hypothetical protein IPL49_02705 [Saprospirales bacterium]|nr:hypothetical protein [Saprospirales bacterium]MBK8489827.1 hypothetical protein [Saprospirales bacterium]